MLTLNIIHLIKNKTIPIKYNIKLLNTSTKKYKYNELNKNIIEVIDLLNSLSIVYLYIYRYISLKQKILLSTNHIKCISTLKSIASLTSTYYINNTPGLFSNWILEKKKLIIYKWLKYFFITNLIRKNKYKNNIYINHILYHLYFKLKLKYGGLKILTTLPNTVIYLSLDNNKFLKELLKLNKNIILISNIKLKKFLFTNFIQIHTINKNSIIMNFILEIITTAILHGMLV